MSELDQLQAKRNRVRASLGAVFNSPVGKEIIEVLEIEINADRLMGKDAYETYYRIGQYDLLQLLRKLGEEDGR